MTSFFGQGSRFRDIDTYLTVTDAVDFNLSFYVVGTYCLSNQSEPTPCPIGTFNGANGSSNCSACQPGRTCPFEGMSVSLPCPNGMRGKFICVVCNSTMFKNTVCMKQRLKKSF